MKRYALIGAGAFLLAVIGKHFLLESAAPPVDTEALPQQQLTLQEPCDLRQAPCIASDASGRSIRFSIAPNTIPLMKDLLVTVETTGMTNIQTARVTVEGVNMYMGFQYANLQPAGSDKLAGKLVLPVCSMEKMQWKANLEISTDTVRLLAVFPFATMRE